MPQLAEQVQNKSDNPLENDQQVMNKNTTRPSCFSSCPARYNEDCQDCHFTNECHTRFNEALFYGE